MSLLALLWAALTPIARGGSGKGPCLRPEFGVVQPSDASFGSRFGIAIALDARRLVVSAIGDPDNELKGAVYVFRLEGNGTSEDLVDGHWVQEDKLVASDPVRGAQFGNDVAISGEWVIVGRRYHGTSGSFSGSAYVFRLDNAGTPDNPSDDRWVEHEKLAPSDPGPNDAFGTSVAISGNRAVVGATRCGAISQCTAFGAAYVFRLDDGGTPSDPTDDRWVEEQILAPSDPVMGNRFGADVAIDDQRIAVGSPRTNDAGTLSGSAYVFRLTKQSDPPPPSPDPWVVQAKLVPSDGAAFDSFGVGLALAGDIVVAGAQGDDDFGSASGSAYVFRLADAGTPTQPEDDEWVEVTKLKPSEGFVLAQFGRTIAASGDGIIVGASGDYATPYGGEAAYVFRRERGGTPSDPSDDVWMQEAKLIASDLGGNDEFGSAVGIREHYAVVGAPYHSGSTDTMGIVYEFVAGQACFDLRDYGRFQNCFGSDGSSLCGSFDLQAEGRIDLQDYRLFVSTLQGP